MISSVRLLLSLFLATLFILAPLPISFADNVSLKKKPDQIERRLKSIKALLNTSSLAKHIKAGKSKEAKELRIKALEHHKKAIAAFEEGDYDLAASLLIKAQKIMFKAVRATDFSKSSNKKKRREFDHRLKTLRALIEAHKRVSAEKGLNRADILAEVNKALDEANALVGAGKIDKGRKELDIAYDLVTVSIRSMRDGDRKARLLIFETIKDEYIFVRRYNDDYIKLVADFIEELKNNSGSPKLISRIIGYQKKAIKLRKEAQSQADSGMYEKAIKVVEESTREFKKVLRALGFPIP